jgi:hypothetical protein
MLVFMDSPFFHSGIHFASGPPTISSDKMVLNPYTTPLLRVLPHTILQFVPLDTNVGNQHTEIRVPLPMYGSECVQKLVKKTRIDKLCRCLLSTTMQKLRLSNKLKKWEIKGKRNQHIISIYEISRYISFSLHLGFYADICLHMIYPSILFGWIFLHTCLEATTLARILLINCFMNKGTQRRLIVLIISPRPCHHYRHS